MTLVAVPNVIGLGRVGAENALDSLLLRHIARFPFSADGEGLADSQSPPEGRIGRF
jgi:hypothetical protein